MGDIPPPRRLRTFDLCAKCSSIPFQTLFGSSRAARQRTLCDLKHAAAQAKKGCRFCAFLVECHKLAYEDDHNSNVTSGSNPVLKLQIYPKNPEESDGAEEPWFEQVGLWIDAQAGPALWLQFVNHGNTRSDLKGPLICVSCVPSDPELQNPDGIVPRKRTEEEVSSKKLEYGLIKGWLRECLQNHSVNCKGSAAFTRQVLSLRLIDVHTRELISTEHDKPYVALSYVWGPDLARVMLEVWRTWKLQSGAHTLPNGLPQTIEDAIEVTQALGYQYLWVDAFCIDQIDEQGLRHHIGNMHLVFECATLTIAAMDGDNASAGLCGVSRTFKKFHQPSVTIPYGEFTATSVHEFWARQALSPWESRAWTLQELLLSKRVLFLHEEYAMMRCNTETFVDMLDANQTSDRPLFLQSERHFWENGFDVIIGDKKWNFIYFDALLANYTRRLLTHQTDVLFACQGALNQFTRNTGVSFAKGLPQADMSLSLLWKPHFDETLTRRSGFPTWSWAGWLGRTEYHYCIVNLLVNENEGPNTASAAAELDQRSVKRQMMEASTAQVEELAFIEVVGPDESILRMGTQSIQIKVRQIQSRVKTSRVRYNKPSAHPSVATDYWTLLDTSGKPMPNHVGELPAFGMVPYSFRTDQATSEEIRGSNCRCQLVFVRYFPALCDSRETGEAKWLFEYVACLVTIPSVVGSPHGPYVRIGMVFLKAEDWTKLDPQNIAIDIA